MFFVLSGFLIVTLLLREQAERGSISLRNFYARRTLRIFPIYYLLLISLTVIFLWIDPDAKMAAPFFADLPYYATYTSNFINAGTMLGISWSLAAEEQFYLVWPPIEKLLRRAAIPVLLVVIILNQLINFRILDPLLIAWTGKEQADLPMLQATFTPICLGVLAAHLLHSRGGFDTMRRFLGGYWAPALTAIVVILASSSPQADISGLSRLLVQLAMMLWLCSCVVRQDHALSSVLNLSPVARIGRISYGMYLYHLFALHLVSSIDRVNWWGSQFVLCLGLAVLLSELSFRIIERPILGLRRR